MAVILIVAAAMIAPRSARYVMNMKAQAGKICICIDPGHGGSDPGKVGTNGTKEKDINLIQREIQAIIRQITASVTFLPLLDELCILFFNL